MTKPAIWASRLPLAPLRSVAEVTRPIRAVIDARTIEGPAAAKRPTPDEMVAELARRAAEEAERRAVDAVEIHADPPGRPRLSPSDRFDVLPAGELAPWTAHRPGGSGLVGADLTVDEARYGVAVCVEVLERCAEPLSLMTELGRMLEPGGRLYLVTPLTVPDPGRPPGRPQRRDGRRYGLNYLLDAARLRIEHLERLVPSDHFERSEHLERSGRNDSYAVIARRSPQSEP